MKIATDIKMLKLKLAHQLDEARVTAVVLDLWIDGKAFDKTLASIARDLRLSAKFAGNLDKTKK